MEDEKCICNEGIHDCWENPDCSCKNCHDEENVYHEYVSFENDRLNEND